jgi:hypothetical protein
LKFIDVENILPQGLVRMHASPEPSHAVTAYYLTVLAALGYLISLAPLPPSGG